MNTLPKARTENLVEQNLDKEILIYDLLTDKAFNLNETSTIVYQACDGKTTFAELRRKHKFTDEFVFLALDELKRNDLLAKEAVYTSPFADTNRREVIKKVGLASMFVLPIISGLIAPKAINAASNAGGDGRGGSNYYNRGFLEACASGGPFCEGSSYRCVNNTCCSRVSTGSLPPSATFITGAGDGSFFILPAVNGSCDNLNQDFCLGENCCSGEVDQTSSCDIRPLYGYEETENEIVTCLIYSCSCTCR